MCIFKLLKSWIIERCGTGDSKGAQVRYVLDYYKGRDEGDGNAVFHVDARPALDSFQSFYDRIQVSLKDWWYQ